MDQQRHVCDSYLAWFVCKAPNNKISNCPIHLISFWKPFHYVGFPHSVLTHWEELGPTVSCIVQAHVKSVSFRIEMENGKIGRGIE